MEDQILYADSTEEVASDENPLKKLLRKEQRLLAKLQEEQEAAGRAQDRFQRTKRRLQRRRKRVERIQIKLVRIREQLADLQITDQQPVYREDEIVIVPTSESSTYAASEEITLLQSEQNNVVVQESDEPSPTYMEYPASDIDVPDQENEPIQIEVSDVPAVDSDEESENEQEYFLPQQETTSPAPFTYEPIETIVEPETVTTLEESSEEEPVATLDSIAIESEAVVIDGDDIFSETDNERRPTKPLQLEQPDLPAASHTSEIQSAKEAWIAAESAMQNVRNTAHGIATSIAFLSQTNGLSNEFMEELVRKQADANRELLNAQDAARAAYERFVQAQRDSQSATSQSMNTSDSSYQQTQEDASLPSAEENGLDQTAKLHAVRLYTEL